MDSGSGLVVDRALMDLRFFDYDRDVLGSLSYGWDLLGDRLT